MFQRWLEATNELLGCCWDFTLHVLPDNWTRCQRCRGAAPSALHMNMKFSFILTEHEDCWLEGCKLTFHHVPRPKPHHSKWVGLTWIGFFHVAQFGLYFQLLLRLTLHLYDSGTVPAYAVVEVLDGSERVVNGRTCYENDRVFVPLEMAKPVPSRSDDGDQDGKNGKATHEKPNVEVRGSRSEAEGTKSAAFGCPARPPC